MNFSDHLRTTGNALQRWFIAQCIDCLAIAMLWLVGLLLVGVPFAPLWAVLGGLLQFVPHFGPVIAVAGPAIAEGLSGGFERIVYVFILYAVIALSDGLLLQPYIMHRTVKVPIWASILAPLVLGFVIPFWGVLLAAPLLAVIYTYRGKLRNPAVVTETEKRRDS